MSNYTHSHSVRRTHIWGHNHPIQEDTPLLALAAAAAAWEGASRAPVGQCGEGSGHVLLSVLLCLLGLPMTGLLEAGSASSVGKSCVMVESRPGEFMLRALKLSQRDWDSWGLRMLSAVTQGWALPSSEVRRLRQKDKTMPPELLARMAPGSLQPTKAAGWGCLCLTALLLGQRPQSQQHWEPWCSWKLWQLPGCPGGHLSPCARARSSQPGQAAVGVPGLF